MTTQTQLSLIPSIVPNKTVSKPVVNQLTLDINRAINSQTIVMNAVIEKATPNAIAPYPNSELLALPEANNTSLDSEDNDINTHIESLFDGETKHWKGDNIWFTGEHDVNWGVIGKGEVLNFSSLLLARKYRNILASFSQFEVSQVSLTKPYSFTISSYSGCDLDFALECLSKFDLSKVPGSQPDLLKELKAYLK